MTHQFKTSCKREKLKDIRHFLTEVLNDIGLSEKESNKVVLAVDEVCANLMIHSNKDNPNENLEVYVQDEGDKIKFEIVDHGEAFDYTHYKEPAIDDIVMSKRRGGLGIMLVKKIMDQVEFKCEKSRNVCCMTKNIDKKK
ncbi:ATP-binding protein [Reichenbachiella versicolor]|uniref:ATP-binding protein n=1 Tax=Reichenbachiella versicolor TaxID=1821036 RepID=UPI000D6DE4EF|nr:ATP-binding protein [Reichenbachiella versicolor]